MMFPVIIMEGVGGWQAVRVAVKVKQNVFVGVYTGVGVKVHVGVNQVVGVGLYAGVRMGDGGEDGMLTFLTQAV